jgi:uncharacterized protein YjiS (DUF1127 family)
MSNNSHTLAPAHSWLGNLGESPIAFRRTVTDSIVGMWRRYWVRRTQHATMRLLQSLDDRTLKDIGISRDEIPYLALGPD